MLYLFQQQALYILVRTFYKEDFFFQQNNGIVKIRMWDTLLVTWFSKIVVIWFSPRDREELSENVFLLHMVINTYNWSTHREQETVACSVLSGGVGITSLPLEAQRSLQNSAEKTVRARGNVYFREAVFACHDSAIAYVNSHWLRLYMVKPVKTQSGWRRSSGNPIPPWGAINDFLGRESQFSSVKWSLKVYPCSSTRPINMYIQASLNILNELTKEKST